MERVKILTKLVLKGERAKANALLDNIYSENECRAYSVALEKIILIETAKALNDSVRGFYLDCGSLKTAFFSDNPPTRKTVLDTFRDLICDALDTDNPALTEKAKDFIKRNIADNQLTVKRVSEYVGITEKSLSGLFRENTGETPAGYIRRNRVEKSLSYLENGESIAITSEKSGFSSVETYIRAFKKEMGTTPGLWKRNKLFL